MTIQRKDIIPSQDEKFMAWGNRLIESLPPDMGVADEARQTLSTKMSELTELTKRLTEAQTTSKQASELKKKARQEVEKLYRAEIRRIKARSDYTVAAGILMGIETTQKSSNMTGKVPQLTAFDRTGGVVALGFSKKGSDGVFIYSQRNGETEWSILGDTNRSPFIDRRPLLVSGQAELRRYAAVFIKQGQEVGEFSPEVVIACAP